ncbi:hypothetical protein [Oscillatoria sp. FACHB-1406]|nr:hypothetical protein [Oscillatoria sp. FACHB-1406]MBD2576508.1 hypothetical protein [Oscillatoria sp. FACHB-1406]
MNSQLETFPDFCLNPLRRVETFRDGSSLGGGQFRARRQQGCSIAGIAE